MTVRALPVWVLLSMLMAGCVQDRSPVPDVRDDAGQGASGADGPWNYTTPHLAGPQRVLEYEGRVSPDEFPFSGSFPAGAAVGPLQTCCSLDWIDAADLLVENELVALRFTLNWTNTPENRASLAAAACVPWNCVTFQERPDVSLTLGAHSDTLTLITAGQPAGGDAVRVGARYVNAVLSTGLPYSLRVEVAPVAHALAMADPYEFTIPPNGTITAELWGPFAKTISVGLLLYDDSDRPFHWHAFQGAHLSRHDVPLEPGTYVAFPLAAEGGFLRFSTDRAADRLEFRRLDEEFSIEPVATVDAAPDQGTLSFMAPPASLDIFPWFQYAQAAVQDGITSPGGGAPRGSYVTLASSGGIIATVDLAQLSTSSPQGGSGRLCIQCSTFVSFAPENYVDDDGVYEVAWSSRGAPGEFVLFTARYVR